jgi:hypothetical protein
MKRARKFKRISFVIFQIVTLMVSVAKGLFFERPPPGRAPLARVRIFFEVPSFFQIALGSKQIHETPV